MIDRVKLFINKYFSFVDKLDNKRFAYILVICTIISLITLSDWFFVFFGIMLLCYILLLIKSNC